MSGIVIHPEVEAAIKSASPIVVLESAVLTSGLPNEPWHEDWSRDALLTSVPDWNPSSPLASELGRRMEAEVRARGAVPCTTAVLEGQLHLGIDDDQLQKLVKRGHGHKAGATTMALALEGGGSAGTTVSGALIACRHMHASSGHSDWAPTMATGGIGGVHRNWQVRPDISTDLRTLASTRACVVSAGSKSILDTDATLELLESLGVPVLGWRTDQWPAFTAASRPDAPAIQRVDDAAQVKRICSEQWNTLDLNTCVLLANPIDSQLALNADELDELIKAAEEAAAAGGIAGTDRTPFLLGHLAASTDGRSVAANLALLLANARRAADIACLLAGPHLA
ncbi:MAG: pseudouridine-5'-phosphate glycosidase [Phycisphaerales bacterium]|nr:pseudouridine-5'-phosphate glycosidase [Phycisphaerales bacterium]